MYPAAHWLSLIEPPEAGEFPGTGPDGNGISEQLRTRDEYLYNVKACLRCHQVGGEFTRGHPDAERYDSSLDAWDARVRMGQRGAEMSMWMSRFGRESGLAMFADWSDRIATGEAPPAPPRPRGLERNLVLTQWEWTDEMGKIHDEASTDKRNPTVNANGPIYGVDIANDNLGHARSEHPHRDDGAYPDPGRPLDHAGVLRGSRATPASRLADLARFNPASIHNPMLDSRGRVWYTATLRPPENQPDWCLGRLRQPVRAVFPGGAVGPQRQLLRPRDRRVHDGGHLLRQPPPAVRVRRQRDPVPQPAQQRRVRLGRHEAVRRDRRRAAVAGLVPDRGGHQRRRADHEAVERAVRGRRRPLRGGRHPGAPTTSIRGWTRASRWGPTASSSARSTALSGARRTPIPGRSSAWWSATIRRRAASPRSSRCPRSAGTWRRAGERGFMPRGLDVDRNGVLWTALSGTNHLASFDRSKCGPLTGPDAHTGRHLRGRLGRCIRCRVPPSRGRTSGPTTTTTKWSLYEENGNKSGDYVDVLR